MPNQSMNRIAELALDLCRCWREEAIAARTTIEFSSRLRRSLGRSMPASLKVRLHAALQTGTEDVLREVLCHELAHIVAYARHGNAIAPHGVEWQALVREAGYEPTVRLEAGLNIAGRQANRVGRYVHRCPVCHTSRTARRRMYRWRCTQCVEQGLAGELQIEEIR